MSFAVGLPDGAANPALVVRTLRLDAPTFRLLFEQLGPSLGLWRAAEVAALRTQDYERPVLDLGCGDGMVTSLVLNRVDVGLDPDEHALAQAARRGIYDRFEAQVAESSHLPDSSIATVVSNSVLEHVEHIDAVLAFVGRILRPGGRLIFTAPTEAFGAWLAVPNAHYACWRNRQLIHLNLWSSEQWRQRLGQAGLEVEIVWPYMRRAFVAGWDAMDLAEHIWIARRRLVGLAWHRIPPGTMEQLARRASRVDLSAFPPGGGRLIVARKR